MRTRISTICILAALLFSGCAKEPAGTPDVPDTPTVGRHLRFSGSVGNDNATTRASWTDNNDGKLTFAWDYSDLDATTSELKMAFIKDGVCLNTVKGNRVADMKILQHTDDEKATDKHWAEFEGTTLRFTIIAQDPTGAEEQGKYRHFTYEIKGETFKNVAGSYDWIPGDLYTFHLYLDDVLRVPEVTVNDWIETDIDGGVAEQETRTIWNGKIVGTEDVPATMSVFVTGGSDTKYNAINVKWEHDGTGWMGASTILYEGVASLQQIYACSPYTEDGRVFRTTVSLAKVENKLASGKQYNIALQVGQDKVTLTPAGTSTDFPGGWNNDSEVDLN